MRAVTEKKKIGRNAKQICTRRERKKMKGRDSDEFFFVQTRNDREKGERKKNKQINHNNVEKNKKSIKEASNEQYFNGINTSTLRQAT